MIYTAIYLPVDRPWTDGCTYLDSSGAIHEWAAGEYDADQEKKRGKVADIFIVGYEFNQMKIIGQPSESARKWIKPGMQFKHFNVVPTETKVYHGNYDVVDEAASGGYSSIVNIRCDVCNHMDNR